MNFSSDLFSICKYTHTSIHTHAYFKGQNHSPHSVANFPCPCVCVWGLPGGSVSNEYVCNVGDLCLIPGLGRAPGEGNGYPLQYSGLENSMERGGDRQAISRGVAKSQTRLSDFHMCVYMCIFVFSKLHLFQLLPVCYMQCCIKHTCPHILYMVNIFGGYIIIIKMAGSMRGAHFKSYSHFKSYNAT